MPLFLKHRLLLIHIPKCGGDTVAHHLLSHDDPPFLFVADGSVMINGHTPQHMTWRELMLAGWSTPPGFRVAALIRHPIDRVISEFGYIRAHRPDLHSLTENPTVFLDEFLHVSPASAIRFDHHNLSIHEFLADQNGKIDTAIEVYPVEEMNQLVASLGLPTIRPEDRRNVTWGTETSVLPFSPMDIARITQCYQRDIDWLAADFPNLKSKRYP